MVGVQTNKQLVIVMRTMYEILTPKDLLLNIYSYRMAMPSIGTI